ncbi:MAG TPA: prepilin peptidase [Firmicutes bacterium]|nr:prepilin peptidase [Bacillota bacterium]
MEYVLLFFLGGIIGSFLNACIYRLSRGISLVFPPSSCPHCNHRLGPFDLIPILSYLALRGRCRYCRAAIHRRYLLVELLSAGWLCLAWWLTGEFSVFLWLGINGFFLMLAAAIDLETGLIPNKVTYSGAFFGLLYFALRQPQRLPLALLGGLVGFGVIFLVLMVYPHSIGMGDAKLLGYIGIISGAGHALLALFLASLLGLLSNLPRLIRGGRKTLTTRLAFGPFLALGGLVVLLWGDNLIQWWLNLFL